MSAFGDGTWTVGVDIAPGTYRTEHAVTSGMCYWGIYRSGTNGAVIIANDVGRLIFPVLPFQFGGS